jgi:hypothetical protein
MAPRRLEKYEARCGFQRRVASVAAPTAPHETIEQRRPFDGI